MRHESGPEQIEQGTGGMGVEEVKVGNPDEIVIDEDEVGEAEVKAPSSEKATETKVEQATTRSTINPDEILLDDEEEEVVKPPPPPPAPAASTSQQGPGRQTKFLALDKCLPRRQFLEVSLSAHPSSYLLLFFDRLTVLRPDHAHSTLTFSFRRVATATLL